MDRIKKSDNKIKRSDRKEKDTSIIRPIVNNYRRLQGKQDVSYKSNNEESSDQVVDDAVEDTINASKTTVYGVGRKTVKSFQTKEMNITRNLQLRSTHSPFINKAGVTFRNKLASLINTSRNAITNTKVITVAIASVGSIAIVFPILICMIGLLSGSSFGIFMATEDTGTGYTLTSVVQEAKAEYIDEIGKIKSDNPHDVFEMEEPVFNWSEILSVYSVIVSENSDTITFDFDKAETLKDVFWNFIEFNLETAAYDETVSEETYDEFGNLYEIETTVTKTKLTISTEIKSLSDIISLYALDGNQTAQLDELLSEEKQNLWADIENILKDIKFL